MRKLYALFLTALILLSCSACGSADSGIDGTINTDVELPKNGKKGPSADLIQEDINNSLSTINPHAALVGVETVKSLTEDSRYEITLLLDAQSKFADWQYELFMSYTKYDQGWMLDDMYLNNTTYSVTRYPSAQEMTAFINEEFPDGSTSYANAVPASNGIVTIEANGENGIIKFTWIKNFDYKHGTNSAEYLSYWSYNCESDNWKLIPYLETEDIPDEFPVLVTYNTLVAEANLSGTWGKDVIQFTISDFTGDSFNAQWNDISSHFTVTTSIHDVPLDKSSMKDMVYYNDGKSNYYICLQYSENATKIVIGYWKNYKSMSLTSYASIEEDLPSLS